MMQLRQTDNFYFLCKCRGGGVIMQERSSAGLNKQDGTSGGGKEEVAGEERSDNISLAPGEPSPRP